MSVGDYWLVAWAAVDSAWGAEGQGEPKEVGPQSLAALARSGPQWSVRAEAPWGEELGEKWRGKGSSAAAVRELKGRRFWPSEPLLVRVSIGGGMAVVGGIGTGCAWWDSYSRYQDKVEMQANSSSAKPSSPSKPTHHPQQQQKPQEKQTYELPMAADASLDSSVTVIGGQSPDLKKGNTGEGGGGLGGSGGGGGGRHGGGGKRVLVRWLKLGVLAVFCVLLGAGWMRVSSRSRRPPARVIGNNNNNNNNNKWGGFVSRASGSSSSIV